MLAGPGLDLTGNTMSAKQIDVTCPCCSARITVDVTSGNVMRTVRAEDTTAAGGDRWAAAQETVRGRTKSGADKLESALEEERGKKDRLDDLFRKAQEKLKRPDTD
jgi:hypothetical protein